MEIDKKASRIQKLDEVIFVKTFFVGTMFVVLPCDLITESSMTLAKYLTILQIHVAGFLI